MADNRPGTFIWCMGGTQHTVGNNNTRAYCTFQLALGNMGVSGGGANIFRGHDNVQGSWKHWSRVWDLDYDWVKGQFDDGSYEKKGDKDVHVMNTKGMPVSRWIDGVLEEKDNIAQKDNIKAMFFWGHAPNSQTRGT
ncbi:Formate dehydrogenase, nitrate-inducible, major subunit [Nymphon striatum]|nr:Formate dehydrogenase, nitrate-inducible, major subunit [Nymphon striatum]